MKADVRIAVSHSTTLIREDTDLLVLLLHYAQQENKYTFFLSVKANAYKMYHINELKMVMGTKLCSQLFFLLA